LTRGPWTQNALHRLLSQPATARICKKRERRNLIVLMLESQELTALGPWNKDFPTMSPFLTRLALNSTLFENFDQEPYTGWTEGSLYAAQCGLPDVSGNLRDYTGIPRSTKCVGPLLKQAGVELISLYTTLMAGTILAESGWEHTRGRDHLLEHDMPVAKYLNSTVFPRLAELNARKKPFAFVWGTEGVHLKIPFVDEALPSRLEEGADRVRVVFDQVDQVMEYFFTALEATSFASTTDVFVYGDHRHMSNTWWLWQPERPELDINRRRVLMLLPLHPKARVTSRVTAYDVGPTILDLLGVCYSPPFVWGRSLLSEVNKTPTCPTDDDFKIVSEMMRIKLGSTDIEGMARPRKRKIKKKR
jgi:hypothetical protein